MKKNTKLYILGPVWFHRKVDDPKNKNLFPSKLTLLPNTPKFCKTFPPRAYSVKVSRGRYRQFEVLQADVKYYRLPTIKGGIYPVNGQKLVVSFAKNVSFFLLNFDL